MSIIMRHVLSVLTVIILLFVSCSKTNSQNLAAGKGAAESNQHNTDQALLDQVKPILDEAGIPADHAQRVLTALASGPAFIQDLQAALSGDPYLRVLVDKQHALPLGYEPADLTGLKDSSYRVSRQGLMLRRPAADALEKMATAARQEGITLIASSTYRTYAYQETVYARNVRESGQATADRESARPGHSQHQLGLVVDFGSIDDSFAETPGGRWILANASSFGWSLSFPQGYESVTGYRWESWHYRYVGQSLTHFIDTYFGGIQQYALQFLYAWETLKTPL
ncbi:MAG: M15 family metallopeptidase [Treponema sp.]|jgi:D-alanyl-D-alanine carboxypeptidase|nr:M15 family metallopeptidase [Treponema sp.]